MGWSARVTLRQYQNINIIWSNTDSHVHTYVYGNILEPPLPPPPPLVQQFLYPALYYWESGWSLAVIISPFTSVNAGFNPIQTRADMWIAFSVSIWLREFSLWHNFVGFFPPHLKLNYLINHLFTGLFRLMTCGFGFRSIYPIYVSFHVRLFLSVFVYVTSETAHFCHCLLILTGFFRLKSCSAKGSFEESLVSFQKDNILIYSNPTSTQFNYSFRTTFIQKI